MADFDPGPPKAVAQHFEELPSFAAERKRFWYDWGPIFYRGRLNGSAKLLCIASDPGPTERIAGRTLVGDAGQRVQGFLTKLGLTRGYVLVNAFPYALRPSWAIGSVHLLSQPEHLTWRNRLLDLVTGPGLEGIVAFGLQARTALDLWADAPDVPTHRVAHPSSREPARLLTEWRDAVESLRGVVTPDDGGDNTGANYGATFDESDYSRIPPGDLPYGLPAWFGDDAWGRTAQPKHNNSVRRPDEDPLHTLVWQAPPDQP